MPSGIPALGDRRDGAAVHPDLRAGVIAARPRAQHEVRDRRDAGSASPRNPSVAIALEIVGAADLARRMPLDGQPRILRLHPLAIVVDANQLLAAELDGDGDAPRAGVDGVLDQLLDDGGRPLDDFAGGDLVGEIGWQPMDLGIDQRSDPFVAAEEREHRPRSGRP